MSTAIVLIGWLWLPVECQSAGITSLAISPDGTVLAVGSDDGCRLLEWPPDEGDFRADPQAGQKVAAADFPVNAISFNADGSQLLICGGAPSDTGRAVIVDTGTGQRRCHAVLGHDALFACRWIDNERVALGGLDGTCWIVDAGSGQTLETFQFHSRGIVALEWIEAEQLLLTGSLDQTIRVIDPGTGSLKRALSNHTQALTAVALQPRAANSAAPAVIASAGHDRTVRFWQPRIGRLMRFVRLQSVPLCLAWHSDGKAIFAGCDDGSVVRIDSLTLAQSVIVPRSDHPVWAILAAPREMLISAGADGRISQTTLRTIPVPSP